jgi:hypothetical protein
MKNEGTVRLRPVGDVELWFAQPEDCQWMLPLHVEWKCAPGGETFGLVLPGVCFYQIQLLAVDAILRRHSLEKRQDRWLLPKAVLQAVLHKAPGIHAQFYYHWPGGTHPPIPSAYHPIQLQVQERPPPRRLEQYRSLAEFISTERGIPADVVVVVLTAIQQVGARWLLEHRQVLDFGWVKLFALPFRANWKEILMFKCRPWRLNSILRYKPRDRDALLKRLGFQAIACSVHNIALKARSKGSDHRVVYTVEAITTESFERVSEAVESERMKTGRTSYVGHYEEAVETFYHQIVESLLHYVRKVDATWATVRASCNKGILSFVPVDRQRAKVRGVPLADLPAHIVPPVSNFSVLAEGEGSDPELIQAQAAEVQKVSALLPPPEDLRQCDGGEPVGVPLRHDSEGAGAGQSMLPCDSTQGGNSSRLDPT